MPNHYEQIELSLTFDFDVNISAQVGDIAYFCPTKINDGFQQGNDNNIVEIGVIIEIKQDGEKLVVKIKRSTPEILGSPSTNYNSAQAFTPKEKEDFIFFSKDNIVNTSSPIGYFAKAKLVNNSKVKSEIFAVACEVFESSK